MGWDPGRLFLLSLLAIPACVGRAAGEDDDDADPERKLGDGCRALLTAYMTCYAEEYETGGYESEGYEYDPATYCDYVLEYQVEYYGEPCVRAQDDVFACLATLDCEALLVADAMTHCRTEYERGNATCPELFPACECSESVSSDGQCGMDCWACLDGSTYAMNCAAVASDGTSMCTCTRDGVDGETFTVDAACDQVSMLARDRCGIP